MPLLPKWEYVTVDLPPTPYKPPTSKDVDERRDAMDVLNDWGARGWEVIQVIDHRALLKRCTPPPELPKPPAKETATNAA